jgi:hypothetical protein
MALRFREERVVLRHASPQPLLALVREPCGEDELSLDGVDTRSAVRLLDRLVDACGFGSAGELSASDRDFLLAALYRGLWGDRIVSSLACRECDALYDLSFELSVLQRQLLEETASVRIEEARQLSDDSDRRYRLPSAEDEERAARMGPKCGVERLLAQITGEEGGDAGSIGRRLEALAPLIDVDLDTTCAECGQAQSARFDIQSFVLQRMLDEREGVLGEVHALASGYGWSLREIVSLPRSLRLALVERIGGARTEVG